MIFRKDLFLRDPETRGITRKILRPHLDILDGMKVQGWRNGYGIIEYTVDGKGFELYPVMPEWCDEYEQMTLEKEL